MTDEQIIELFFRRDERAIRACMTAYEPYCRKVATGILENGEDVQEAVADTWLSVWDSIPPNRPQYLRLFLGRITRNKALSIWRKNHAQNRGGGQTVLALEELGTCVAPGSDPQEVVDTKLLGKHITAFLKTQPQIGCNVFLCRYFYMEEIPAIAIRYHLSENNVRMILSRTRQKLRKYLQKEGYSL